MLLWQSARGALLGLGLFALSANLCLLAGAAVPQWWLPACVVCGLWLGRCGQAVARLAIAPAPRWLSTSTVALVVAIAAVLAWGAMATPPRHWDGVVTWGLKAAALTAQPSLAQPLFADPAVLHHSASYPLLQPLCVAAIAQWCGPGAGRAFFPFVYLLLVATIAGAVARRTRSGQLACWSALGIALLPELIGCGAGAVDSGYADALHALGLAAAAAALLLGDTALLLAAAVMLPFIKPEGTVHAGLLAAVAIGVLPIRVGAMALVGVAGAVSIALPLSAKLAHAPTPSAMLLATPWLAVMVALCLRAMCERLGRRGRWLLMAAAGGALLAVVVLLQARLAGSGSVLFAQYLGRLDRLVDKLPHTPTIGVGLLQSALSPRQFGFTFAGLAMAMLTTWRQRARPSPTAPELRALTWFLGAVGGAIVAAFYLSPEPDPAHHLRSSASRLLLQSTGVAWLLFGALLANLDVGSAPGWLRRWLWPADAARDAT